MKKKTFPSLLVKTQEYLAEYFMSKYRMARIPEGWNSLNRWTDLHNLQHPADYLQGTSFKKPFGRYIWAKQREIQLFIKAGIFSYILGCQAHFQIVEACRWNRWNGRGETNYMWFDTIRFRWANNWTYYGTDWTLGSLSRSLSQFPKYDILTSLDKWVFRKQLKKKPGPLLMAKTFES